MNANQFDRMVHAMTTAFPRRHLLRLLSVLPFCGGLPLLPGASASIVSASKHHKHKKHKKKCKANSTAKTCAGKCGSVKNTCKKTVDCGSCACDPPCDVCFTCQEQGPNAVGVCVVDAEQQGDACGDPGQVCQADGSCACDTSSCSNPTPVCVDGACASCSASNPCLDGCCDGDGACVTCPVCLDIGETCTPTTPETPNACCSGQCGCAGTDCTCRKATCHVIACGETADCCQGTCAVGISQCFE